MLASTTAASFSVNEDRLKSLDAFEEALHQFEVFFVFLYPLKVFFFFFFYLLLYADM